ncbi:MBG domain-containing protein [Citrifermentans bremense]|uniref:MBG domain-containing protein n=1 Tax=Citrifermentans bremense TaxID=60035 RepID=UPI00041C30CC|nr:MBG domain-containing protein [Citrifermentans bremense]
MKPRPLLILLVALFLSFLAGRAQAAVSSLRDGFDIYSSVKIGGAGIRSIAVQPWDGKVIIGGSFTLTGGTPVTTRVNLARLNPDGTLDTTLNHTPQGSVNAIAIQWNQADSALSSIVIGGAFAKIATPEGDVDRNALARIRSGDGFLENFDPITSAAAVVNALVLPPGSGDIVVGGSFSQVSHTAPCSNIARISLADGTLKSSFSGGVSGGEVFAIALQNGNVVAGGSFTGSAGYLARFTSAGLPDPSFRAYPNGAVRALAVQVDGRLVLGGDFTGIHVGAGRVFHPREHLARTAGDGTIDDFDPAPDGSVAAVALQPDGKFVIGGEFTEITKPGLALPASSRNHAARLNIDGTLDGFDPAPDLKVAAALVQLDGKILIAGDFDNVAGAPRTKLARFYPEGHLDEGAVAIGSKIVSLMDGTDIGANILTFYAHPDGKMDIGGLFSNVEGAARNRFARLEKDWSLDLDPPGNLQLNNGVLVIAPYLNGDILVAGQFGVMNGAPQNQVFRLKSNGALDSDFNDKMNLLIAGEVMPGLQMARAVGMTPTGKMLPDQTPEMDIFIAGASSDPYYDESGAELNPRFFLAKVDHAGDVNATFAANVYALPPSLIGGEITALTVQGRKIVVGTTNGGVLRLNENGTKDESFNELQLGVGMINSIQQTADGKLMVAGTFTSTYTGPDGKSWKRHILRVDNNGAIDNTFNVETTYIRPDGRELTGSFYAIAVQADGNMIVSGNFNTVRDGKETTATRWHIARLTPKGGLDPDFDYGFLGGKRADFNLNMVNAVGKQLDGKLVMAGAFRSIGDDIEKRVLERFSDGWAPQEVVVQPDGKAVRWERRGTGPEFARVTFDHSPDGVEWLPLGPAERVAGTANWELSGNGFDLGASGMLATRFLRARGYMTNHRGGAGPIMETIRVFYLKPEPVKQEQTIDPGDFTDKTYGDPDFDPGGSSTSGLPLTYTSSDPGVAIVVGGEIRIIGAGTATITVSQGGDDSFEPAEDVTVSFTVAKAPLRVAADDKVRAYLTPNPALSASYLGFVKGEGVSVLSGSPSLSTAALLVSSVGEYAIAAALGTLSSQNYRFLPVDGTLRIFKSCQEIYFPPIPERTFGDPPFNIVASACSGLTLSFASSNPEVAQVNGQTVTITGAGSAVITVSQPGTGSLEPAPERLQPLVVHKSGQGVAFSSLAQKVVGDPPFPLQASATSALPVSYASSDPLVAEVTGNMVTIVGAGTCVITARQTGNNDFEPALPVSQPLTVASEGVAPALSLSALSDGAVTSNPVLNLMGEASDLSGIATLTVNGEEVTAEAASFSSAVALAPGSNSVSVSALDRAGNRTTRTLNITLDPLAPVISVAFPSDNSVTDTPSCAVKGSVTPGSAVTLWLNGASPQLLGVEQGSFTGSAYLSEGVNTIEFAAELSGRSSRVKRSVILAPRGPAIAITEPAQDLRTERQSLTIRGSTTLQQPGSVTLEVDGVPFTPLISAGGFEQQVTLSRTGEIRIRARGGGSAGESGVAQRNLIRVELIPGDLDGNGSVDLQDAARLLRGSLGLEPMSAELFAHGDLAPLVNGIPQPDGAVDVGDVLVLLRRIVGLVDF